LRFGRSPDEQLPDVPGLPDADRTLGDRRHGEENDEDGEDISNESSIKFIFAEKTLFFFFASN
jgi:hypothetical protein